jgi:glycerol uptake facilitator protein
MFQAYLFECIGTALLLLGGTATVANVVLHGTKGNGSGWIVITTGWALSVYIAVVVSAEYSGAHLNPAVSIGLATAGMLDWAVVPGYIVAQLLGACIGALITWILYFDHFKQTENKALKLAVFATAPAIRNTPVNLMSEIVGTFVLVFVVFFLSGAELQPFEADAVPIGLGSVGAVPVAFLVWMIGLALGGTTGYAINPARDFGPRLVHALAPISAKGDSDWSYAWIPIVGPIIGAVLAAWLFLALS